MSDFLDPEVRLDILDTLQTAVAAVSLDGKIVYWNDGAERITGYLRHEVLGHQCTESFLLHCDQRSCELCGEACPRTVAQHNTRTIQSRNSIHNKSGERVAVHSWIVPLRTLTALRLRCHSALKVQVRRLIPTAATKVRTILAYGTPRPAWPATRGCTRTCAMHSIHLTSYMCHSRC